MDYAKTYFTASVSNAGIFCHGSVKSGEFVVLVLSAVAEITSHIF